MSFEQPDLLAETTAAAPVVLNTAHARAMLHKRYPPPEWAMLEEVAPATGGGTRYADGIAVNLWQSRGHAVHGFETKVIADRLGIANRTAESHIAALIEAFQAGNRTGMAVKAVRMGIV